MKKLSLISMGLVLLMALTQCKKAETPSANEMEGEKVHITLDVDNGEKNFVHPETGNTFFTNGDEVLVANNGHYVGTLTYSSSNRHFSGDITGAVETDYLHFYFMGNQDLAEGTPSSSTATFTVNISDQTNCYPQIAYNRSSAFYSESVTSYKTKLLNQCALVEFTSNEIPVETAVTLSGLNNTVSVNLGTKEFSFSQTNGGNITLHAESTTSRWAILLPQSGLSGVSVNAEGCDNASVSFNVSAITYNDYFPAGATMTLAAPLTLEAITAGTIEVNNPKSGMKYSKNGEVQEGEPTSITVSAGDKVQLYGNGTSITSYSGTTIGGSAAVKVYGNIMSLVNETGYASATTLENKAFAQLFQGNDKLTDASGLLLPATTLATQCYGQMFFNCTSLTAAPTLPATTLVSNCYERMFCGCTSLTTAPALPATTLASSCYNGMFSGCTSLTTAPDELPATTLAEGCYSAMFGNCTSLTAAPALPATTLARNCYSGMFQNCTSLTTAPALSVTTLAISCYQNMFNGCTSLTTAPELPATTLANRCYFQMFNGCTSLTTAPTLPAPELVSGCYYRMFYDCSSLSSITCLATSGINLSSSTTGWMTNAGSDVTGTKTFTRASGASVSEDSSGSGSTWPRSDSGIPDGWTVEDAQ